MSNNIISKIRSKGVKGTYKAVKKRVGKLFTHPDQEKEDLLRRVAEIQACYSTYKRMKETGAEESTLEELRSRILALENGKTRKYLKQLYVKQILPSIYASESKLPLENKVLFMENGYSPSPSNKHLSDVLREQGKYEIKHIGLGIRRVPDVEYYDNACDFIRELATAKGLFLTSANDLLSQFDLRPETRVIQLWHGAGVLKKIGYSTQDNPNFGLSKADREEYYQYRNYNYVTVPAEEQIWIFEDAMRIPRESGIIVPVGRSCTDVMYDRDYIDKAYNDLYSNFPQAQGKKIILYAPTFRGSTRNAKAPDALDISLMAEALSSEYILLVKHHNLSKDAPPIPDDIKNSFAFDLMEDRALNIEQLLCVADICITDYSAISFEYALTERPIIFFAYDLEDYMDQRGLYYDFEDITPGPVVRTTEEIVDYILHLDDRFDKEEVVAFKKKYVGMCDGHATERTIALLEDQW